MCRVQWPELGVFNFLLVKGMKGRGLLCGPGNILDNIIIIIIVVLTEWSRKTEFP